VVIDVSAVQKDADAFAVNHHGVHERFFEARGLRIRSLLCTMTMDMDMERVVGSRFNIPTGV
jgi:hypothetical protein